MKGALNENTFFAMVAMADQGTNRPVLVVEGDDDYMVVDRHISKSDVVLICGVGGRDFLLRVAKRMDDRDIGTVRFLMDSDFDRYVDTAPVIQPANVILSTNHDAMIDIVLVSPILLYQIVETHSRSAQRRGKVIDSEKVCLDAFTLATSVAPLRIVNQRQNYELNLRDFPFGRISASRPVIAKIAKIAVDRSKPGVDLTVLTNEVEQEASKVGNSDPKLVGDHDYFAALARVLSSKGAQVSGETLWTGFLGAVACDHIARTDWFNEISEWCLAYARQAFKCPCPV